MELLDLDGGFDVHEYRSSLKLRRQDEASMALENRGELGCPACGQEFERLFVTEDDATTFASAPSGPICVVRAPTRLLVLTH